MTRICLELFFPLIVKKSFFFINKSFFNQITKNFSNSSGKFNGQFKLCRVLDKYFDGFFFKIFPQKLILCALKSMIGTHSFTIGKNRLLKDSLIDYLIRSSLSYFFRPKLLCKSLEFLKLNQNSNYFYVTAHRD